MIDCNCKHPELKPENGECSEERIKKCHGDQKNIHAVAAKTIKL